MNFLAHLSLSDDQEGLMIGNAIADFTRRKYYADFPAEVQRGILLHHFIDDYTDSHAVVREMLERWRPVQGKYAGVVNDIIMDHFLARDYSNIVGKELQDFSQDVYKTFRKHWELLPGRAQHTFTFMEKGDWLYHYQFRSGIERSLGGMSRRAHYSNRMAEAVLQLKRDEAFFEECFQRFYPELEGAVIDYLNKKP